MKRLLFLAFTSSTLALAGGGSSIGPGAPQIEYDCRDGTGNVLALIGRWAPNYVETIVVETIVPMTLTSDSDGVQKISSPAMGGALTVKGSRFEIQLAVSAPIFEMGNTFVAATLQDHLRDQVGAKPQSLQLACRVIQAE